MTSAVQQHRGGYLDRPSSSSLADVVEMILDKGLVIDAYVRVSLVGIELLTIDARIVIASVDTYLRFAEATNRLDLYEHGGKDLGELAQSITEGGAKGKTSGAISGAKEKVGELLHGDNDDDDDSGTTQRRRPRQHQGTPRRRTRHEDDDE
ncbi:MAG: Gas vesicle protein [Jatrophihabitans sp.]|nr:Gas vesicle protein [Jatrophihabitans sp.]